MSLVLGLASIALFGGVAEKEVSFVGAGGVTLVGTFSLPAASSSGKLPGVLLLPGSGPTDRDGNQPPGIKTDVLKQISDMLVQSGFATFRFDKRACHVYMPQLLKLQKTEYADYFKWDNFVGDATAALRYLGSQPRVDSQRLALIGHSEGAEISLQIGSNLAKDPFRPAAIVTMGGAGRPMGPILHEQILNSLTRQKQPAPVIKLYMDYVDKATAQIVSEGTFPPNPPTGLDALFNITTTKLMQSYCGIDPSDLAKKCIGPFLLLNGANDTQVSPERDTPKLKAALESRPEGTVEVLIVPNASHNFKETTATTNDVFDGPIVPLALAKIKQFLTKQLHP